MLAFLSQRLAAVLTLFVLAGLFPAATAAQPGLPNLGSPAFVPTWARTDYPVVAASVKRTYYYGPAANLVCDEAYKEAPGGKRQVSYLDKGRLELTNPATGVVTTGLLARELIGGKAQLGDAEYRDLGAAAVPVAGDPVESAAPTYASFAKVSTLEGTQNRADRRTGQPVTATLNRAGEVGNDASLARYGVTLTEYRDELGHNIPNVFVDFFGQRGPIAQINDDQIAIVDDQQLIDGLQVMGLPLAEPYWATVPVGGAQKWVLIQPYQRRVITYTPDNDADFRVEMGNIGQHYASWRHPDGTCAERTVAPPPSTSEPVPAAVNNGIGASVNPQTGTASTPFAVTIAALDTAEPVGVWFTDPAGDVWYPPNRQVNMPKGVSLKVVTIPKDTFSTVTPGIWAFTAQGVNSGKSGVAYFRITGSAAAPAPAPAPPAGVPAADYSGNWSGQTSKSQPISFSVRDGRVTNVAFKVVTDRRCTITITAAAASIPINGQSFKGTFTSNGGSTYVVTGEFKSATTAEGLIDYALSQEFPASCRGEGTNGWTATKK